MSVACQEVPLAWGESLGEVRAHVDEMGGLARAAVSKDLDRLPAGIEKIGRAIGRGKPSGEVVWRDLDERVRPKTEIEEPTGIRASLSV